MDKRYINVKCFISEGFPALAKMYGEMTYFGYFLCEGNEVKTCKGMQGMQGDVRI